MSSGTNGMDSGRYLSVGSNCLCGECIYNIYHDVSKRMSFPRSIADFLMYVYSFGSGVVPHGNRRHRKEIPPTIAM